MGDIDTDVSFSNAETGRMPTPNKLNLLWQNARLNAGAISGQTPQGGVSDGDYFLILGTDGKLHKVNASNLLTTNALGNSTFEIDQRQLGTGVALGASQFIVDRWQATKAGLAGATLSAARQQVKLGLGQKGYATSSLYMQQGGTPVASPAAGDWTGFNHYLEGPFAATLVGRPMSLTLLVHCTQAPFTFTVSFRDPGTTQSYVALATVPVANLWTTITIPNIPAPTGGGFTAANALPGVIGMYFNIIVATGTTFRAPVANQWVSGNFLSAPGASNFAGLPTNSIFYLGFAQLEVGSVCSPPIVPTFDQNLFACQRYFQKSYPYSVKPGTAGATSYAVGNTMTAFAGAYQPFTNIRFNQTMCKVPTGQSYHYTSGAAGQGQLWFASSGTIPISTSLVTFSSINTHQNGISSVSASGTSTSLAYVLFEWSADTGF